jgi:hypothetical protein
MMFILLSCYRELVIKINRNKYLLLYELLCCEIEIYYYIRNLLAYNYYKHKIYDRSFSIHCLDFS